MNNKESSHKQMAPWKVLLPVAEENRVLAMGLEPDEIADLSRTYRCMHTMLNLTQYDIVILGKKLKSANLVHKYLSTIVEGGTLVIIGCSYNRSFLKQNSFIRVGEYAGLPSKRPRLYIPLKSTNTRHIGMSFHCPGSYRNKVWVWVIKTLNSVGISAHLRQNIISIWSTSGGKSNVPSIKRWISQKTGWDVDETVVYTGSESNNHKITVLAMSSECNERIVAKIADAPNANVAVRRESEALRILVQSSLASAVPRLIGDGDCGPYFIQLQSCLPKARQQCRILTNTHICFLSKLSRINRIELPIHKTEEWNIVDNLAASCNATRIPEVIKKLISIYRDINREKIVECHMTHGDFTPWNIIYNKDTIFVYDWEESNPAGFPFHDVFHFIYRQASLVGPWPDAAAILKMMRDAARILAHSSDIRCDVMHALALWCIREYTVKPNPRLIELAVKIERMKHE